MLAVAVHRGDDICREQGWKDPELLTPRGRNALESVPYGISIGVTIASGWRRLMAASMLR